MKEKAKFLASAPQWVVQNVVETAEFYRDKLGFSIVDYFAEPPVYAMVERDGLQIHFGKADNDQVQKSNLPLRKVGFDMYFWVKDIEALFNEYKASEVEISEGLTKRIYGNLEFSIIDCNGFKIVFGEQP